MYLYVYIHIMKQKVSRNIDVYLSCVEVGNKHGCMNCTSYYRSALTKGYIKYVFSQTCLIFDY